MVTMKKVIPNLLMIYLSLATGPAVSATDATTLNKDSKLAEADKTTPFYTISYVKENSIAPGIFETEGYITFIHQIKGCNTPDSICPPGSDTSVIIVHEQKNGPADTAIRIKITKDTKGLQKGQRYRFTIKAETGKMASQSKLQNLQLLEFHLLQ
jgi:hypothetical protein